LSAWRREFLNRFPALQTEAQAASYAGALMQRPLFFVLKDAIDRCDAGTIASVVSYVRWLDEHEPSHCATELEEDLLGPITDSERLANGLLSALTASEFTQIKKYCVLGWQGPEERASKLRRLEKQFAECSRFRERGAPNVV
jgi:hypothetical protein